MSTGAGVNFGLLLIAFLIRGKNRSVRPGIEGHLSEGKLCPEKRIEPVLSQPSFAQDEVSLLLSEHRPGYAHTHSSSLSLTTFQAT